jgi:tetratricopeptide (TPR) repeat protein
MDEESALRGAAAHGEVNAIADLGLHLASDFDLAQDLGMPPVYRERIDEGMCWLRRAGEAGHVAAMLRVAELAGRMGRADEEEQWLGRAVEAGDVGACGRLWRVLDRRGRHAEVAVWYRRLLPGLVETRDPAMFDMAKHLALLGLHDEAEAGVEALPPVPFDPWAGIGGVLERNGRLEEASRWYRRAAENGNMYALVTLGDLDVRRGDLARAEAHYRRAADDGLDHAKVRLGLLMERMDRLDEAEGRLRSALGLYDDELPAFLERRGRVEEAERERRRRAERRRFTEHPVAAARDDDRVPPATGALPVPELLTVVATVAVTTAVLPFVQALVAKAAEDTYDGVRRLLRRLVDAHASRRGSAASEGTLLVVEDPHAGLRLHIRTDETDEALSALDELEQAIEATDRPRGVTVFWDSATRTWRSRS